jgi:putative hemolysin
MLARLQKLPNVGDTVEFDGRRYTVTEIEGHRVAKVKIEVAEASSASLST